MVEIYRASSFVGALKCALQARRSSRRTVRSRRPRPALRAGSAGWLYSGVDRAAKCNAMVAFVVQRRGPIAGRNLGRGPEDAGVLDNISNPAGGGARPK